METISIKKLFHGNIFTLQEQVVTTGFQSIDDVILGMQPADLVVIGGRPGMGKTTLALNMVYHEAAQGYPILYFALDTPKNQVSSILLSIHSKIPYKQILLNHPANIKDNKVEESIKEISELPIYFNFSSAIHIKEILNHIREAVEFQHVKVVYIDYLQFIAKDEEIADCIMSGEICYQLKLLAKELGITIVLLSELNRQVEYREGCDGKIPQLSDLYGSARIEELADKVLMIFRPEYYHISIDIEGNDLRNVIQIHVVKNKFGLTGIVSFFFDNETLKLY